ncbi:MAG: GNAT family N-acetyltransferase [Nitrospirae bacterium]|nr:GNAT family N-acetyltransferase [Nitrospirota bacterium]
MMSTLRIVRYEPSLREGWDTFITRSKNGTFLFFRGYMDYHSDRFQDHSLMVWNQPGHLVAVLPANRAGDRLISHGGLTYGGFVVDDTMKTPEMLAIFDGALQYLCEQGIRSVVYKTVPYIYHRCPAEEDRYALFLSQAALIRRDVLSVVDRARPVPLQERRRRGVHKAERNGLSVGRTHAFEAFWPLLDCTLTERHGTAPVHTLEEITRLSEQFPEHIHLVGCFQGGAMLAGVVLYQSERVSHAQYIAANEHGRALGALDLLFHRLLTDEKDGRQFFDFGISNEQNGRYLNRGLIEQKEGFGARAVAHDHYEIDISAWESGRLIGASE